jgi:hypothetical protein
MLVRLLKEVRYEPRHTSGARGMEGSGEISEIVEIRSRASSAF